MTKLKNKSEVLLDNEFFKCTRSVDNEGRTEYGLSYYKSIKDTINRLIQLHLREANYLDDLKKLDLRQEKSSLCNPIKE